MLNLVKINLEGLKNWVIKKYEKELPVHNSINGHLDVMLDVKIIIVLVNLQNQQKDN